jgi:hypothetical protein
MQLNLTIPDTTDEQIAEIDAQIKALQVRRDEVQRCRSVACEHCHATTPIRELTYVQSHWYERPHGCTGGDNWWPGDAFFDCPHCKRENRIPKTATTYVKQSPHLGLYGLGRYFGATVDTHDR